MGTPNLMCIGAQKAGTTWLHGMLSQHPDVFNAPLKEVHFFDFVHTQDGRQQAKRRVRDSIKSRIKDYRKSTKNPDPGHIEWLKSLSEGKRIFTPEWYKQVFAGPGSDGKIAFEVTPAYSAMPLRDIKYLREVVGVIPIVYIIRDPLNRMLSQLRMSASRKYGDAEISEIDWIMLYKRMRERGDYRQFIPRWTTVYPENNLHFIPFKRISNEPAELMRFIESLVDLPPFDYRDLGEKRLSSKRFDVPPLLVDVLSKHVAPQYKFLEKQFGKEFVSQI